MSQVQDPLLEQAKTLKRAKDAVYQATYRKAHPTEIITRRAVHYQAHRVKIIAHQVAYAQSHKEKIAAREKVYRDVYPDIIAARMAAWRARHTEEIKAYQEAYRLAHKTETVKYQAVYRKSHLGAHSLRESQRRARKQGNGGSFTSVEWEQLKDTYKQRCAYCGKRTRLTMDHVVPLSKNGLHGSSNIVPACKSCNSKKGIYCPPPFQLALSLQLSGQDNETLRVSTGKL